MILEKIHDMLFGEEERITLEEKVEKRFIPSSRRHGASGEMSKMVVHEKEQGPPKIWGWSGMFEWLMNVENVPPIDLTFGREKPMEEFRVVKKGELEYKE